MTIEELIEVLKRMPDLRRDIKVQMGTQMLDIIRVVPENERSFGAKIVIVEAAASWVQ